MKPGTMMRSLIFLLAVLGLLSLGQLQPGKAALPTPNTPEPYPGSDIYPAEIRLETYADLAALNELAIDVEGIRPAVAGSVLPGTGGEFIPVIVTVYIRPEEASRLSAIGLTPVPIPNEGVRAYHQYGPGKESPPGWPTFDQFVARMETLESNYPALVQLVSIGQSVQGRDLWCLKISDNVDAEEDEPEFKYTAAIHGDETTGIEMTLRLAELLAESYGLDPALTTLVDDMETWLCPITNPDGYVLGRRYNYNGVDLNRDFPDRFTDPINDPAGHEQETQVMMLFGYAHNFVMGANYHGGEQVLNYPWDAVAAPGDPIIADYAPDDALFYDFGLGYTTRNPMLYYGDFPQGLTRGWQWYQVWGGMQDWAYFWQGEHHVTIEISYAKYPSYSQMDTYWDNNEEAMLWWMSQALTGLRGRVLDARDSTPLEATVTVVDMDAPNSVWTDPDVGDYHRVIGAGVYTLTASADGYLSQSDTVAVIEGEQAAVLDFALCPAIPWTVSGVVTEAVTGLPLEATLELLGSPMSTHSDPAAGAYSLSACPSTYTLRASAPGYYPQARAIVADQDQTQNFSLVPYSDLESARKSVDRLLAAPGERLAYSLFVQNDGFTTTVRITDTLPAGLTWAGELTATQGLPDFDGAAVHWVGTLTPGDSLTVTYAVTTSLCLPFGELITNQAVFSANGVGVTRTASVSVTNLAPSAPLLIAPSDEAGDQALVTLLQWQASQDANCDALTYDIYLGTALTPTLVVSDWLTTTFTTAQLNGHTNYTWQIVASDAVSQTASPVWRFSTVNQPPSLPALIAPVDFATNVPVTATLNWEASDGDNDPLSYTLAFGTTTPPPVAAIGLSFPVYDPGVLDPSTTYFWQVMVSDGWIEIPGPTWQFTTQQPWFELFLPLLFVP